MSEAKDSLDIRFILGATPGFREARFLVEAALPGPSERWPDLLAGSVAAARKLAATLDSGAPLERAAADIESRPAGGDPWTAWLDAFAGIHGTGEWRTETEQLEASRVRIRTAIPYAGAVRRWAMLGLDLLWLAGRPPSGPETAKRVADLRRRIATIGSELPVPRLIPFHAALDEAQLPWAWRGGNATIVGSGSRQRVVRGVPADPAEAARTLADAMPLIPVFTVTGSLGKTTTVRMLAQLLGAGGMRIGRTESDGIWIGDAQIKVGDSIGAGSAFRVVSDPAVDAAVLEFGRGGLIERGIPFKQTAIGILLNVEDIHIGADGVGSIPEMADVKAVSLAPARLALLNRDDEHCRRIGEERGAASTLWFSTTLAAGDLQQLSRTAAGAAGVARGRKEAPRAIEIWRGGEKEASLDLAGVRPFKGTLGEKTIEELLAAVTAAWFAPVDLPDWEAAMRAIRLDDSNHPFHASEHICGDLLFVLDKAGHAPDMALLLQSIEAISRRHGIVHRIAVFTRSPKFPPPHNLRACVAMHPHFDEFVCFDRPETYAAKTAIPDYEQGSIPRLLGAELERLNAAAGVDKPVHLAADWAAVEDFLRSRLAAVDDKTLVLINQPATATPALNKRILAFVEARQEELAS